MRDLNYELKQVCQRNRDGSFATRADREQILSQIATQLVVLGFLHMGVDSLKPKHVVALVECWKADGIAIGTIKNRMTALRWWAEKIGKDNVVARSNAAYGIGHRTLVTNISKAQTLNPERLAAVADPFSAISLRLQAAFGLRREESIKIMPKWADLGDTLRLKASWTKGGRYREVPITTTEQREALDAAKALVKNA